MIDYSNNEFNVFFFFRKYSCSWKKYLNDAIKLPAGYTHNSLFEIPIQIHMYVNTVIYKMCLFTEFDVVNWLGALKLM